jgi:diguanylate cyclase (GGDEF)-like protein
VKRAPIPPTESQRIRVLRSLDVLDSVPEERFDRITRIARRMFGVPMAMVSLVDERRQWFKSVQGLDLRETPRDVSFCGHAVAADKPLVVLDAATDERFHDNPLVLEQPTAVRFYAGIPLRSNGAAVGTLCIVDREPREFPDEEFAALADLAAMVEEELAAVHSATTDMLTGISNRRGFETVAAKTFALATRLGGPVSLLVFDLDGFKPINDTLGHAVGDRALVDFAQTLTRTFRDADVVARLGGDEFVVLAYGPSTTMSVPLERFASNLAALEGRPYKLAYSVGIVERDQHHDSLASMFDDADRAMYATKLQRKTLPPPTKEAPR